MTPGEIEAFCRALPGATAQIQWESDLVFKVGGRMFAVAGPTGSLSFKVNDVAFEMLADTGVARPAPYLARAKWLLLDDPAVLPGEDLKAYLRESHAIIAARLTRKQRAELALS